MNEKTTTNPYNILFRMFILFNEISNHNNKSIVTKMKDITSKEERKDIIKQNKAIQIIIWSSHFSPVPVAHPLKKEGI